MSHPFIRLRRLKPAEVSVNVCNESKCFPPKNIRGWTPTGINAKKHKFSVA